MQFEDKTIEDKTIALNPSTYVYIYSIFIFLFKYLSIFNSNTYSFNLKKNNEFNK